MLRCLVFSLVLASCQAAPVASDTGETHTVRVALCQMEIDPRPEVNLERIEAAIAEAAEQGADLACFPEACVFGWTNPAAHEHAAAIPGETTERIGALAARHGVMVVVGLAERDGTQLFNSVVLIDSDGDLLLRHRKVNVLAELMDPPYTPGPGAAGSVVDTRLGRVGLLICADTFEAQLVEELAAQSPDLVLVPYGWAAPREAWPEHGASLTAWVRHTARTCRAPVVGVDSTGVMPVGPWAGYELGGQSVACDASGRVLEVLPDREPVVRVLTLERAPQTGR
jgi:N-carbamoylputrescine amidase